MGRVVEVNQNKIVCCLSGLCCGVLLRATSIIQHNVPINDEITNDNLGVVGVLAFFVIKIKKNG